MQLGLRATSSGPQRFGDESFIVKSSKGSVIKVIQNTQRGRKLDATGFTADQLEIVRQLQECGLIC